MLFRSKVETPLLKNPQLTNGHVTTQDVTHDWLWPRMSSWLRSGDVVVTETGTSFVGIWETRFPTGVQAINQTLWSSIGYGVGAAQGAALAMKTLGGGRRTVCFEGDGKFLIRVGSQLCPVLTKSRIIPAHSPRAFNHHQTRLGLHYLPNRERRLRNRALGARHEGQVQRHQ